MIRHDEMATNPTLVNRLNNWRDRDAWIEFFVRYDPVIRSHFRGYGLDAETTEELCQRVWVHLARRMRTFRYDPEKTFRGWLRLFCHSRAIDYLRKKKVDAVLFLVEEPAASFLQTSSSVLEGEEEEASERLLLLAADVQAVVKRRVDPKTWEIFWQIAIEGRAIREIAEGSGLTYFAAFAAQKRVRRMLLEEGQRLLIERRVDNSKVGQVGDQC